MKPNSTLREELARLLFSSSINIPRYEDLNKILQTKVNKLGAIIEKKQDQAVIEYRDRMSTKGRPLNDKPLLEDMPACHGCGSTHYADWTLWPHQLYNSVYPGGVDTHCFPCFAEKAIVSVIQRKQLEAKIEAISDFCTNYFTKNRQSEFDEDYYNLAKYETGILEAELEALNENND